jgi:hypothetical protein
MAAADALTHVNDDHAPVPIEEGVRETESTVRSVHPLDLADTVTVKAVG